MMFQLRSKEEVFNLLLSIKKSHGRDGLENYYERLIKSLYETGGDPKEIAAQHAICMEAMSEVTKLDNQ